MLVFCSLMFLICSEIAQLYLRRHIRGFVVSYDSERCAIHRSVRVGYGVCSQALFNINEPFGRRLKWSVRTCRTGMISVKWFAYQHLCMLEYASYFQCSCTGVSGMVMSLKDLRC